MSQDGANLIPESMERLSGQEGSASGVQNDRNSAENDHPKKRRDKGAVHTTHCGWLSLDIERALVRSGESPRNLRRYKRKFRAAFKPRGTLGELIFERWWTSHCRQVLIARLEAKLLVPDHSHRRSPILPELREGDPPLLVTPSGPTEFEGEPLRDLFSGLALAQRYVSYHAREEYRAGGLLLLMREGGEDALLKFISDGENQKG